MRKLIIYSLMVLVFGCAKRTEHIAQGPEKTLLILPAKDEACLTATDFSATESMVTFEWKKAANVDTYEIQVTNFLDGTVVTKRTTADHIALPLPKGTPFKWKVVSISSSDNQMVSSDTWRFYNSSPGLVAHVPFPAELLSPKFGETIAFQTGKADFTWKGSDIDKDIAYYAFYLGTDANQLQLVSKEIKSETVTGVTVKANTRYFWKVSTTDKRGNISESEISQFMVK